MEDQNTLFWEVPEIDLCLRHYSGSPSDVIKKIKGIIENYLGNPKLAEKQLITRYDDSGEPYTVTYNIREVYSAVYSALNYYKDISYLPSAEFGTGDTFLSNCIRTFNEDLAYLSDKYNSKDPTEPPVIQIVARIKSPLSFVNKVREKVTEYIDQNRDFNYFTESLRDLIGVRILVDPPKEIVALGKEAELEFIYKVTYDLMERHGVTRQNQKNETDFTFIPVNTRHEPFKAQKIKERPEKSGYAPHVNLDDGSIYIPTKRIPEIDQECVDSVIKDYTMYPKFGGYQSLHACVVPAYSTEVEAPELPKYIIPPKNDYRVFEYQIRSIEQNEYAERGPASHDVEYKPIGDYHRLAVPFYIAQDLPEYLSEDTSEIESIFHKNKLRLRNFGESLKKFYGFSFETYFGIPFKKFRDTFGSDDRNAILAKKKRVEFDRAKGIYSAVSNEDQPVIITLTSKELLALREILSTSNATELTNLFKNTKLMDSIIEPVTIDPTLSRQEIATPPPTIKPIDVRRHVQLMPMEISEDRINARPGPTIKPIKLVLSKPVEIRKKTDDGPSLDD